MKTLSSVLLVVLTAAFAHAGTPLPVTDVPVFTGATGSISRATVF